MAESTPSASQRTTGVWIAGGLFVLVFGTTLALTLPPYVDRTNPFWFVGMLVIFGGALALFAIAFSWLNLASRDEAFGLPIGSVRTLLAVGVMVLFAVFGLAAVSINDSSFATRLAEPPIGTATAPSGAPALEAELRRYERQGIAAVVESVAGATATLRLYRTERIKPVEISEIQKQLITALVTLLTSVVSFYFGSRTVEAARDTRDPAKTPPAGGLVDLPALDAAIDAAAQRFAALQAEPAVNGNEAALGAALASLTAELAALRDDRARLGAALAGPAAGAQATIDQAAALKQRIDAFGQRLAEAEGLVAKG